MSLDTEEEHQFGALHYKGQRRDDAAEEHTASIAHEHLGRVEVPDQEPGAGDASVVSALLYPADQLKAE